MPAAANDDSQRSYAAALRNLNRRLPNTIFWMTGLVSLLWIAGAAYVGFAFFGASAFSPANIVRLLLTPAGIAFVAGTLLPVILFWAFAIMIRRTQELKIAAQSMTEVAFRLAEPESLAQGPRLGGWSGCAP